MPADRPTDAPSGPTTFVAAVRRRWWLVLLFAGVGAGLGFLLYATRQPTYRSEAKLRVLKRDAARDLTAGRSGYVDDYVNSQQETILSEYILGPAATSPKMKQASPAFQERLKGDSTVAYDALRSSLAVTRGKDSTVGLANSVLLLSYTSDDPRDARIALEAVIDTFSRDLKSKSDESVKDAVRKVQTELDGLDEQFKKAVEDRTAAANKRFEVTTEERGTLATRQGVWEAELVRVEQELLEVQGDLELIRNVKPDRRDREALATYLTAAAARRAADATSSLEAQKALLELKAKELGESLGRDHPEMKQVLAQLEYIKGELVRQTPTGTTGPADELSLLQVQRERRKKTLDLQKADLESRKSNLASMIRDLGPQENRIEQLDATIGWLKVQQGNKSAELSRLQASQKSTDELGGIEATVLNQPRDGARVGPVLITWLMPGVFAGAVMAIGLALLLELRDQRFRTPAEVRERLGLPVVGHLPAIRLSKSTEAEAPAGLDPSLVAAVRPRSAEAEAFRGLRTQVFKSAESSGHTVLQITSPRPSDGKSTLAANLAISIAQAGKSVVLIDADFRKPRVHTLFQLPSDAPGLAAATEGEADVFAVVKPTPVEQLSVLPCGPRPYAPAELLSSPRFSEVLKSLKSRFDYVIVDTPPLLAVSDPRVVAQRADAVLLTLRLTATSRADGVRATEMLTDLGVNVLGVAVNATRPDEGYGYGGYKYQYEADGYTA